MSSTKKDLKSIQERNLQALRLRPSIGRGTATTTARLRHGSLTADVADGPWSFVADAGADEGGGGQGPDPGVLMRGALASCLAMGYRMWAARTDLKLDEVTVTVEADYDASGQYGVDETVPPGYGAVRVTVDIVSDAPAERLREMVATADRHSPLMYDVTSALPLQSNLRIRAVTERNAATATGAGG